MLPQIHIPLMGNMDMFQEGFHENEGTERHLGTLEICLGIFTFAAPFFESRMHAVILIMLVFSNVF